MSKNQPFPWGIYIGDLIDNDDTIPLCLDSKKGGFSVLFDESSEQVANNFIENVALKLFRFGLDKWGHYMVLNMVLLIKMEKLY